jgi:peptidoglycan hydrolase-like protein with peptidoglycan-binding domain
MRPVESRDPIVPFVPAQCGPASREAVRDAQEAINFLAGTDELPTTGDLDQATARSLALFQRDHGLPETGCPDERTRTALLEAVHAHASARGAEASASPGRSVGRPRADTRVNIDFRTFAPFRDFGGGFEGDGRSFSLDPAASSRMRTRVEVSTRENTARIHHSTSGTHHTAGILDPRNAATRGHALIEQVSEGVSRMTFGQTGSNPQLPSPDIDRRASVILDERTPGILRLHIAAEGDTFPNAEMTISDVTGQTIFLDGFATRLGEHGPFSLFGYDDAPLLEADMNVLVDGRGRFLGVVLPNGEPITIEQWNRQQLRMERDLANASGAGRQRN